MAAIENWLINLIGEKLIGGYYLWVLEIFLIVVFSFIAGYLINKLINILEKHASKSKTVWDDAIIEAKGLTIRERLKQHATDQTCASCHARIDPLGFALESFDPIGRWREKYTSGLPIDSSGKLFGEAEFKDIEAFKDAILERPEKFMRAFSEHLLSYALGRELKITDKPSIDKITRRVMADHGRFSTVVVEIAKSIPFRHKTGQNESK